MGEEKRKSRVWLGLALCIGMGLLTGCKEEKVDYDIEGVTENTQEENGGNEAPGRGKKGLGQFANAEDWYDMWETADKKGNTIEILVDANITVPDVEQMPVVEVKEPEFNAAYQKQLAERLFGDSEIYYSDDGPLPVSYIDEIYPLNKHEADEYMGTCEGVYEGKSFELSFFESDSFHVEVNAFTRTCRNKEILFQAKDIFKICPDEVKEVEELTYRALTLSLIHI